MLEEKRHFLLFTFPEVLKTLDKNKVGLWGKMNVQQMIEHMSDSVREANGKAKKMIHTDVEKLPAMKGFLLSEKEFRPNTKNALMPEEPQPVRNSSVEAAISELEGELKDFELYFKEDRTKKGVNPFFGELNYEEWIHLLHKHAIHHLKQFGALDNQTLK